MRESIVKLKSKEKGRVGGEGRRRGNFLMGLYIR